MKFTGKFALLAATALLLAPLPTSAAGEKAPLVIAEQGNFRVGGREVEVPGGTVVAGAMYVEYQVPAEPKHPYPLVFLHGGASDGSAFWSTPDGREGWATLFLRKGYSVYVVDRPTLGRSPHYEVADGPKLMPPLALPPADEEAAPVPQPQPATRFPGVRESGDPAHEQDLRRRHSTIEVPFGAPRDPLELSAYVDTIDREAGAALLDRIGPAILVTHSRAGTSGWQIADARPDLVKAIVAAEPNGPPFYNVPPLGRPDEAPARPYGLTYAPIEFDPPIAGIEDFGPLRQEAAPSPSTFGCWVATGTPRRLVGLDETPVLVLTGGSSYHAAYDYCTADFLQLMGVPAEYVLLDDRGIAGNSHGFPTETNNDEIADLIAEWLDQRGL